MMKRSWKVLLTLMLALCCLIASAEEVEKLTPRYEVMEIKVGESMLTRYSSSTNAMKKAGVTYEIDDESIATVNAKGYVRGVAPGECTLTITSRHNPSVSAAIKVRVIVPMKKITAEIPSSTIGVGSSMQIEYGFVPENATNKSIRFSSNKPHLADVDSTGLITGVRKGDAVITVSDASGDIRTTLKVKVVQMPESVTIKQQDVSLPVGKKTKLAASVLPSTASDKTVVWSSSDEAVAKVDRNGSVTAVSAGEAVITAACRADESVQASIPVQCVLPVESIAVDVSEFVLAFGESAVVTPTVLPETATNRTVAYHVRNPQVCAVDENGVITTRGGGQTTVTVMATDGSGVEAAFTVRSIVQIEGASFLEKNCRAEAGGHAFIKPRLYPSGTSAANMNWHSSDESVATVSILGDRVRVQGHSWGSCTVTGATMDGRISASIQVHVGHPRDAVILQSVKSLKAKLHNSSNLPITAVTFRIEGRDGQTYKATAAVNIAPGETAEGVEITLPDGVRASAVALEAWESSDGYYDHQDVLRSSYRTAPGLLSWISLK